MNPNLLEYVDFMERIKTHTLIRNSLDETIARFFILNSSEDQRERYADSLLSLSFPHSAASVLHDTVEDIWLEHQEDLEFDDEELRARIYGRGTLTGLNTAAIMEISHDAVRFMMAMWSSFRKSAIGHSKEVFVCEFYALNYSLYAARVSLLAMYAMGFVLLLVPTLVTSLLILGSAWHQL